MLRALGQSQGRAGGGHGNRRQGSLRLTATPSAKGPGKEAKLLQGGAWASTVGYPLHVARHNDVQAVYGRAERGGWSCPATSS